MPAWNEGKKKGRKKGEKKRRERRKRGEYMIYETYYEMHQKMV